VPAPGDHFSLLDPPNVAEVARLIRAWLDGGGGAFRGARGSKPA
jgi:thioesterase domain-containing protein